MSTVNKIKKNEMTDLRTSHIKEAFCLFDRDADGLIHVRDFSTLIRSLGVRASDTEINTMLKDVDEEYLKYNDVVNIAGDLIKDADVEAELTKAFKNFDRNNTGVISSSELKHVMLNLGERLQENEIDELVALGDPTGTGSIPYKQFVAKLLSVP